MLIEVSVQVPTQLHGAFIGKSGEHIDGLRRQSGCKIEVCLSSHGLLMQDVVYAITLC